MTEAVILAGGLGTRLRAAVPDLPKPMAPVAGRPFLEWLLERWIGQGIGRFVLSVGYRHEAIEAHFGARYQGAEIDYAVEAAPLGTGGGLLLGAARVRGTAPFVVLNGDTWLDVELRPLLEAHAQRGADVTLALVPKTAEGRYGGVKVSDEGRVLGFGDAAAASVNGGVYVFSRGALEGLERAAGEPVSLEQDLFPALLARGARVHAMPCAGKFLDIGVPADYARAAALLAG